MINSRIYRFYLMYGTIVMSLHDTKEDAEKQLKYYIDKKVVRYPELLTVEPFGVDVVG